MKPGIHNLPAEEYHALKDHLSAGIAKVILEQSPAHARWKSENGDSEPTKQSERGIIAHALLLEGVSKMEVIDPKDYPAKNGNIPEGWTNGAIRAARDAAREAGKLPVLPWDAEPIHAMVAAARKAWSECPDLQGYGPENGITERSLIWSENGVLCRAKPDWYSNDRRVMLDPKFTEIATPERCSRSIISQAFDQRAAFYRRGGVAVSGVQPIYVYAFQEIEPPYCTSFHACDPAMLALGDAKVDYALGKWRECRETGNWPGYDNHIHYATAPAWALDQWGVQP